MGTIFHIVKISLVWAAICALNNATTSILDVFYKDLTERVISQMKANRYTCYNAGAIFDFISSKLCERKTLVMAENSQKPLPYFLKWRKQCKVKSDKGSKTTQIAHEDLNDVDDPTKEVAVKAKWKFQPRWLKKQPMAGLWSRKQQHEVQFMWVCLANIRISLLWRFFFCYESHTFEHIFFGALFVILKISTLCLTGKERQKQNILTSHSGNINFKLERV